MNRILLAHSLSTFRSALALLLETRLNVQIVGQVNSLEGLLCEAAAVQPDFVILSRELLGEPARTRLNALRQQAPYGKILVVCARPDVDLPVDCTDAVFCHTDLPETIVAAIQSLMQVSASKDICQRDKLLL